MTHKKHTFWSGFITPLLLFGVILLLVYPFKTLHSLITIFITLLYALLFFKEHRLKDESLNTYKNGFQYGHLIIIVFNLIWICLSNKIGFVL